MCLRTQTGSNAAAAAAAASNVDKTGRTLTMMGTSASAWWPLTYFTVHNVCLLCLSRNKISVARSLKFGAEVTVWSPSGNLQCTNSAEKIALHFNKRQSQKSFKITLKRLLDVTQSSVKCVTSWLWDDHKISELDRNVVNTMYQIQIQSRSLFNNGLMNFNLVNMLLSHIQHKTGF